MITVKISEGLELRTDFTAGTWVVNGHACTADMLKLDANRYHVLFNNKSYEIELLGKDETGKQLGMVVNGVRKRIQIETPMDALLKSMGLDKAMVSKNNSIKAPMPGLVLRILVTEGQTINKGDGLLVLEAMKMENVLKAQSDGVVKKIHAIEKNAVEKNQLLIELI